MSKHTSSYSSSSTSNDSTINSVSSGKADSVAVGASGYGSSSYGSSSSSSYGASSASSGLSASSSAYDSSAKTAYIGAGSVASASTASADNAMTRSEERLFVGKETVEAGKAGLKKYVTTEHVATSVPVAKERVIVEREPITEANIDSALAGPDFKEAEYEVRLREERAVAQKQAIPIERVRMTKVAEQQQQFVEADLRKEHIEVHDQTGTLAEKTLGVAPTAQTSSSSATTRS